MKFKTRAPEQYSYGRAAPVPWSLISNLLRGAVSAGPLRGERRGAVYVNLFPPSPFPLSFSLSLCTTVQDSAGRYMNMQDATWGMYLDVRYFPYPKIRFEYLKIYRIWNFESLRFHAHFVLLCSSGMQIVVESSGREVKTSN